MTQVLCTRKPPEYKAIFYTGKNLKEILKFLKTDSVLEFNPQTNSFRVWGMDNQYVAPGMWIILENHQLGPIKVVPDDKFKQFYNYVLVE